MPNSSTESGSRSARKTSLGYILGASSPDRPSTGSTYNSSRPSLASDDSPANLLRLPRRLLSLIAYLIVIPPSSRETDPVSSPEVPHPAKLLPLLLTCKSTHAALSLKTNPRLYHDLYVSTFDTAAMIRRYAWITNEMMRQSDGTKRPFDLFGDPKSWAQDYKARWGSRARMRRAVAAGTLEVEGEQKTDILPTLWVIWFLVTENDARNIPFLKASRFQEWVTLYYQERLLKEAQEPGYPRATIDKGLAVWCAILSGTDLAMDHSLSEVDEKIFMLRPMVFACAKYDISIAPWHLQRLPLCKIGCTEPQHIADLAPQSNAIPYDRFGYTWNRAPPHVITGAYLFFFRLLERHAAHFNPPKSGPPPRMLFGQTHTTPSIHHDREWQRSSVCQDPHVSAGLPPTAFLGTIAGRWTGQFLFYSLEQYREVVAGNMRAVYTGQFGAQPMDMDLKETLVKVRKGEEGGDEGAWIVAGYSKHDDEDVEAGQENPEQRRVREGYGHEVVTDPNEPDEEGWTKEILISGMSKSNWGYARIRGRIRAWDGLVILLMNYEQNPRHPMGRWLWRGYLHSGGNLLGRWRDTFTPAHAQGHEGAFGLVRAKDMPEVQEVTIATGEDQEMG